MLDLSRRCVEDNDVSRHKEQKRAPSKCHKPVGGCRTDYQLVNVDYVVKGAGLDSPDPSMDHNGDGCTCLTFRDTGSGTRVTWHDNTTPL
jgi:hypothetical protein